MSYSEYNNLCSDCTKHDECHKTDIDYDKVAICFYNLCKIKEGEKNGKNL